MATTVYLFHAKRSTQPATHYCRATVPPNPTAWHYLGMGTIETEGGPVTTDLPTVEPLIELTKP